MVKLRLWLCLFVMASLLTLVNGNSTATAQDEDDEEPEATQTDANQLEAIGGLSMVTARNTFLLIGVTADAYAKKAYKADRVQSIMKAVIPQLDAVSGQLQKLQKSELGEANNEYIKQIVALYSLLKVQARSLNKYVVKPDEGTLKNFEKARQSALAALDKLTGDSNDEKLADKESENPVESRVKK